jgi:hypothetical protein
VHDCVLSATVTHGTLNCHFRFSDMSFFEIVVMRLRDPHRSAAALANALTERVWGEELSRFLLLAGR